MAWGTELRVYFIGLFGAQTVLVVEDLEQSVGHFIRMFFIKSFSHCQMNVFIVGAIGRLPWSAGLRRGRNRAVMQPEGRPQLTRGGRGRD